MQTWFSTKQCYGGGIQDLLPLGNAVCKIRERFHTSSLTVAEADATLARNIAGIRYHEIKSRKCMHFGLTQLRH